MKLVVIGGVAAGASIAARARRLDESAEIIVLERSQYVSFANCGLPYHIGGVIKERAKLLLQTPQSLRESLDLDVRTGHEAVAIDRAARRVTVRDVAGGTEYQESYDTLALCPGAAPIRPSLPGIDHPRVHVLRHMEDMDAIKAAVDGGAASAIIIGGGYIGVEMAENLRRRGLAVDLVELVDQIMPPLDREMVTQLEDHLRANGVRLHLGTAAAAFREAEGGRVAAELKDGSVLVADLCVLSAGVRPDTTLARQAGLEIGPRGGIKVDRHMRTSDPNIYAAGDAVEVEHTVLPDSWFIPLAGPANRQGRIAADAICGKESAYESSQGTAIVKIFAMSAGGTGATEKNLVRAGVPYRKVYLHPSGHAGYYPGASPLHIKITFAPETGRLLGAQVVGFNGVDKRLDVFATAIRAGMTVFDLENLELAYAPPYGSAKDAVNMAGFVASNLLRGDVALWYPDAYPKDVEGAFLLDVRGTQEYDLWHIPAAVNIPLGRLRASLDQIPRDRPVRLYCKVGFRSYLAYRLLRQRGFGDVATLSGGVDTFRAWHKALPEEEAKGPGVPLLSYAEETMVRAVAPSGRTVEIDCTGLQCPGPIIRIKGKMEDLAPGDEAIVRASDPGFMSDAPAWCRANGHTLVEIGQEGPLVKARIRKGGAGPAPAPPYGAAPAAPGPAGAPATAGHAPAPGIEKKTFVVFSGDLDRAMAAFIIANGALSMGSEVTMFFTFWGLNILRRRDGPAVKKGFLERMFGVMMPRGARRLKLSKLNMLGMGTALMKKVMRDKNVSSLDELVASARGGGAKLVACTMTMDVMGIKREELIDGVELGGVASFLEESDRSRTTLFI